MPTPENRPSRQPLSELLQPSLTDAPAIPGPKPFRVASQFWVAFFGGAAPIAAIAFVNAGRLGMPEKRRWWILIGGLLAVAASIVMAGLILDDLTLGTSSPEVRSSGRTYRLASRGIAVVFALWAQYLMKPAERAYALRTGGEYASLWGPGFLAMVVLGALQFGVTWLVLAAVGP
jgi:hypothetical protein